MSDAAYYRRYRKTAKFRAWSSKHEAKPERRIARSRARTKYRVKNRKKLNTAETARRETKREYVRRLKSVPCADCGRRFPPCCMDFDHREGVKKHARLSYRREKGLPPTTMAAIPLRDITEEVKKCDVVCANCHRIRTWTRRTGKRP